MLSLFLIALIQVFNSVSLIRKSVYFFIDQYHWVYFVCVCTASLISSFIFSISFLRFCLGLFCCSFLKFLIQMLSPCFFNYSYFPIDASYKLLCSHCCMAHIFLYIFCWGLVINAFQFICYLFCDMKFFRIVASTMQIHRILGYHFVRNIYFLTFISLLISYLTICCWWT